MDTDIADIYQRLAAIGANEDYVRNVVLPSWWEDELADNYSGLLMATAYISRNLGIPIELLQDRTKQLEFREMP